MQREIKEIILYLGSTKLGDVNSIAKNRQLTEVLKSETDSATADQLSFDINKKQFDEFIAVNFDESPDAFLKPLKLNVVFLINGLVRFSGDLASRPARTGFGGEQTMTLKFNEKFWRLSGDLVCDPNNRLSPYRKFTDRPAQLYVQDLINESKTRFSEAGDPLNWSYGVVNQLANKSFEYKDFQTVAKALCDAMNNENGSGKFDVVIRTDPNDHSHCIIDILKPRGKEKNIIIQFPSDGVYSLWSSDYSIDETNDFASEIVIAGSGELGTPIETTANIASSSNNNFATDYGYFRQYSSESNLTTMNAVSDKAKTRLEQLDFRLQTPQIKLQGRPISWGDYSNDDNGLALGDSFYFQDNSRSLTEQSGWYRIIGLSTTWDDNGSNVVIPTLKRLA